jgi:hypothetical protein
MPFAEMIDRIARDFAACAEIDDDARTVRLRRLGTCVERE